MFSGLIESIVDHLFKFVLIFSRPLPFWQSEMFIEYKVITLQGWT